MFTRLRVLAICCSCFLGLVIILHSEIFSTERVDLGHYKLASGIEVTLSVRNDLDVGDVLYYAIQKDGVEVVRTTYITNHDRSDPLRVHTTASADQAVLAFWAEDTDLFILYHVPSGESWPRLRDDEVSYAPSVVAKWHARYLVVRGNNPKLPVPMYFREAIHP